MSGALVPGIWVMDGALGARPVARATQTLFSCFVGAVFMVFLRFAIFDLQHAKMRACVHGLVIGRRSGRTCQTALGVALLATPGLVRGLPILVLVVAVLVRWSVKFCSL